MEDPRLVPENLRRRHGIYASTVKDPNKPEYMRNIQLKEPEISLSIIAELRYNKHTPTLVYIWALCRRNSLSEWPDFPPPHPTIC